MSGLIWSKFFWSDWENEPALRLCSFGAQGLWMRMLCVAASHDPIGYVAVAGRGLEIPDLARLTGGDESEVQILLGELERNGVFSRDGKRRIYSRRMVRDAKKAAVARKNGKNGGNPKLRESKEITSSDKPSPTAPLAHGSWPIACENLSQDSERSEGQCARPRDSLVSNDAVLIADDLMKLCKIDVEFVPPGWCGAPMRIQCWLNNGWTHEIIMIGARRAMADKRDGAPSTVTYFEKPIIKELAAQARPMPTAVVVPFNQEKVYVAGQRSNGILEARDSILEDIKRERRLRTGQSDVDARLLSED